MEYLILPGVVVAIVALLHATDPADLNVYVTLWRRFRRSR